MRNDKRSMKNHLQACTKGARAKSWMQPSALMSVPKRNCLPLLSSMRSICQMITISEAKTCACMAKASSRLSSSAGLMKSATVKASTVRLAEIFAWSSVVAKFTQTWNTGPSSKKIPTLAIKSSDVNLLLTSAC